MNRSVRRGPVALSKFAVTGLLVSVAGCSDAAPSLLAPSDFPGSSVDENYLAADGLAFSENGTWTDTGDVQVFRDVANDTAIVVYRSSNQTGNGSVRLSASYFDGSKLTPPVEIVGDGEDLGNDRGVVRVLFLETAGFTSSDSAAQARARARHGDAILVYTADDADDPGSTDRDANTRAYATYFRRSKVKAAAEDGVVHGFQTRAQAIDFDNVLNGGNNDSDVSTVGFVSDSLHGSHEWGGGGDSGGVLSGDPTSFVQIVFRKGLGAGGQGIEGRWVAVPFDLGQDGDAFVPAPAAAAGMLTPARGVLDVDDPGVGNMVVHDGLALWDARDTDVNGEDRVVTASMFSPTGVTAIDLGSPETPDYDRTDLPSATNVYGPDHGLASFFALFSESDYTSRATGSRAQDRDLMVAQIDVGGTTRAIAEIDAFTAAIDNTDADQDGDRVRNGDAGAVSLGFWSRIHSDGGLITVGFLQPSTDLTDLDDNAQGVRRPENNLLARLQVVQTDLDSGSLASSVLAQPLVLPALVSSGDVSQNGIDQANVGAFAPQVGIFDGAARVAGGENAIDSAWQANENRLYVRYTQLDDQNGAGGIDEQRRLFVSGVEVTRRTGAASPTAVLLRGTPAEAVVPLYGTTAGRGVHQNFNLGVDLAAQVIDRGTPAGDFLVFFRGNDNNVPDANAAGAFTSPRLFVSDGVTTSWISSPGQVNWNTQVGAIQLALVSGRVHAIWEEYLGAPTNERGLFSRSFAADPAAVTAMPDVAEAPAALDLPGSGDLGNVFVVPQARTVAVYFAENGHIWYNQTTSDATHYRMAGGLPDPTLVDNDSHVEAETWNLYLDDGATPLSKSFLFYAKGLWSYNDFDPRLFLRIHD